MELLKAISLGVVQGLTEFLPISSSGHLVIFSELLEFQEQGVVFGVFLHLGTLVAVLLVFYREIWAMACAPFQLIKGNRDPEVKQSFLWDVYIVVATVPAILVGLFFKEPIEQLFTNVVVVYCMLVLTGTIMIVSKFVPPRDEKLSFAKSWWVGCAQAFAILPGLSRSGSTIFVGMLLGVNRQKIARFSFIMSIPAILGAVVLQSSSFIENPPTVDALVNIAAGTCASVISGYFAIKLLLDIIRKNRLQWFGYYCMLIAAIGLGHHFIFGA